MLDATLDLPAAPFPVAAPVTRLRSQIESFLVLRRNPLELWGRAAYDEGILAGSFLGREQVLVNDPDAIRHVLVANHENYERNEATRRILRPVLGDGLFLAEGESWRAQRRAIAPSMAPRALDLLARHVAVASAETEATLDGRDGRIVELLPVLQRLALHIASRSMFSLESAAFGAELRSLLFEYGTAHARPGLLDLMLPGRFVSPADQARARFRERWVGLVDRIIAMRRSAPPKDGAPRDLFDLLDAARDPDTGEALSPALLRDEVATMMLAGHETTATALFWACWIAAQRRGDADAIAAEARATDLTPEGAHEALDRLTRTRAHVDETLRLYPPAFLITRQAKAADRIGDHVIRPGTLVSISPFVLHRHRALWAEPERFDPARFMPGATPPARFAYLPFGAGPRICIGARFALIEATVVLARLLARYRFELAPGSEAVLPRGIVTVQPDRPVRFILRRR